MGNSALIQFKRASVCPMSEGRHIIKSEFRERCFIYQSFGVREASFGDQEVFPHVSFLADNGDGSAAEWEPQYGPIQLWTECDESWRGEQNEKPRAHWHFPFVEDRLGDWSQLAVEREGLKGLLARGQVGAIFDVLLRWADR